MRNVHLLRARLHDVRVVERVVSRQVVVRQHVNLFVNGENVRLGQGLHTPVEANAEIWIIPAVSGG